MHIVAYLLIIISNALGNVFYHTLRAFGIENICNFAVYSVCSVIFGLIVNLLVTKI
jgi:hypothetical protein